MQVKEFAKNAANKPGVYQMFSANDQLIYVGKARNLNKRLSSYFRRDLGSRKTEVMMSQVVKIETIITASENEALLLEANLIKRHRPRYNVLLRDDKSYPYLYLATDQDFPRLDFHRGAKRKKGRYFGPYPNAGSVRENLATIQKLFKLRQCGNSFFAHRTRPCLQYQIKRCTAPCVGYVTKEEYGKQVEQAILFLEGKSDQIMHRLEQQMEQASAAKEFEQAALYRDQIIRFRKLQRQQFIIRDSGDVDVLGVAEKMGKLAIAIIFIRGGRLIGHRVYYPKNPLESDSKTALSAFVTQYYLSDLRDEQVINRIVLSETVLDKTWIQNALSEKWEHKVQITDRQQEKYRQWISIACTNAQYALAQKLSEEKSITMQLGELQQVLKLPNPIQYIECFDVSHTQGEATIASCVVYTEQGAQNKLYRRFSIKNITPGDDYAAMHQALMRRYTRLKEGEQRLPDLIIIDGGKGQLKQASQVMEELQISGVVLLGIAKGASRKPGLEKLFIDDQEGAILLSADSIALHLLQFIRDEAHRFAINAHRAKRGKSRTESPLEYVEGIGAKKRQALLKHFGGRQELANASMAEIAKTPGISKTLAQRIYEALH